MQPLGVVAMGLPLWAAASVLLLLIVATCLEGVALALPFGASRRLGLVIVTPARPALPKSATSCAVRAPGCGYGSTLCQFVTDRLSNRPASW